MANYALSGRAEGPVQQLLGEAEDADHGRTQIVRGGGEELALHAVDLGLARDVAEEQDRLRLPLHAAAHHARQHAPHGPRGPRQQQRVRAVGAAGLAQQALHGFVGLTGLAQRGEALVEVLQGHARGGGAPAGHGLEGAVAVGQRAGDVKDHEAVGAQVEHGVQACAALGDGHAGAFAFGHVGDHAHVVRHAAIGRGHRRDGQLVEEERAVLAVVAHHHLHAAAFGHGAAQLVDLGLRLVALLQEAAVAADGLAHVVAGDAVDAAGGHGVALAGTDRQLAGKAHLALQRRQRAHHVQVGRGQQGQRSQADGRHRVVTQVGHVAALLRQGHGDGDAHAARRARRGPGLGEILTVQLGAARPGRPAPRAASCPAGGPASARCPRWRPPPRRRSG